MELFQVCGVAQVRKYCFGLSWKTYESFHDSQLLGKKIAEKRLKKVQELALCLHANDATTRERLKLNDLPENIIGLEHLRVYPVSSGEYIGKGTRLYIMTDGLPNPQPEP